MLKKEPTVVTMDQTNILMIDAYNHKTVQGRIYNQFTSSYTRFYSFMEFVLLLEKGFEVNHYPLRGAALRRFYKEVSNEPFTCTIHADQQRQFRGKLATFILKVKFRQNTSWQGELIFVGKQKKEYFRSVLELMKLMDNALSYVTK